jgi:hypothetical protein
MEKNKETHYRVTSSNEKGVKIATINLSENLSLDEVSTIKHLLVQNLDKFQVFHVVLQEVENIDLGMVQLLYSFKWTAERKSKKVFFDFALSQEHISLLEHAGFYELVNKKQ